MQQAHPTPRQLALVADMLENGEPGANNGCLGEYDDAIEQTIAWLRTIAGTQVVTEVDAAISSLLTAEQRAARAAARTVEDN